MSTLRFPSCSTGSPRICFQQTDAFGASQFDDHQVELFTEFKAAVKKLETDPSTPLPKIEMSAPEPVKREEPPPRRDGVNRYGGRVT